MLLTSPLSSPLKNPVRDVFSPAGSSQSLTAQVQALFASRAGGMWDMGDMSTLYQTFWASTSVTAPNDPIAAVLDKSRPEQDKTAAFIAGNPTSVTGSSITKSGAVLTLSGSAINDEVKFDPIFAADDTYAYCEFTASGSGQILVYAGGSPVAFTLTGSPVASRASMTSNGSSFLIFRAVSAGATGTITVTKVGARKGNHATQPTAGSRPLYQVVGGYGCAQFDGTDDLLNFPAINFSATDKATLVASVTLTGSTNHGLVNFGTAAAGGFHGGYYSPLQAWATAVRGDAGSSLMQVTIASMPAIPHTRVVTFEYDLAGAAAADESKIRLNGVSVPNQVVTAGPAGGGNLQNGTGVIGQSQGIFCFAGNINRFALVGGALTVGERAILEAWAAEGFGITL